MNFHQIWNAVLYTKSLAPSEMPKTLRNFHMGLANIILILCRSGKWKPDISNYSRNPRVSKLNQVNSLLMYGKKHWY